MTRLAFRASVADPRPASAWTMVSVATLTLAITGQLAVWAIAASFVAIAFSFHHRSTPRRFQRSPIFLNCGIFAIMTASIAISLEGGPATIALAHFAALTQGLQLLDARPRKSEFLLVTLALFQVVLASNLTDSVFFPPLLLLFLVSTTWTLLVHTLRSEAIEAGDRQAAPKALRGGLIRITTVATTVSVLLAIVLFMLLPRFRGSMIQNHSGPRAVAGFTDRVELGTIGEIRLDSSVVLRVETLEGDAPEIRLGYWRGIAFDHFDGRLWSVTPSLRSAPGGSPAFGIDLGRGETKEPLVQRIVREPVQGGVLFGAGETRRVHGSIPRVELDMNGSLYSPNDPHQRVRYTIETESHLPSDPELRRDRALPPERRGEAFLDLPPVTEEIQQLAAQITGDHETDADRVRAIENYLQGNGRYTNSPPPMDDTDGKTPVEQFLLGDLSGHCEYFASGMVVLARSAGLPARLVNGFAGGRMNELGGFVELTRSDAHAWVEVHYEHAGWVRYDPTPPDLRLRKAMPISLAVKLAELASVMELWWYQRVVDFDTSDQIQAIRLAWLSWSSLRSSVSDATRAPEPSKKSTGSAWQAPSGALEAGAVVLLAGGGLLLWRGRRREHEGPSLPPTYRKALVLLRRRGLARAPEHTARGFASEVAQNVPPPAAAAFEALTESYLAQRFGARGSRDDRQRLSALKRALRPRGR